jgi:sec-independent protein translocase protein TatB
MFDLGFSELVVCFVIALVVLGPTRMPGLVRSIGRWVGKARAMARQFREQLESEINLDELNRATQKRTEEADKTPPQSAEASGEPPATDTNEVEKLAAGGYPYGPPPEPEPASAPAPSPQPGDDTYSHAHGAGEAPALETAGQSTGPETADENHKAT